MVYKHAISTIVPARNVRIVVETKNEAELSLETENEFVEINN